MNIAQPSLFNVGVNMNYLWSVVCNDGRKFKNVEAATGDEVLIKLGLVKADVCKWYPFPVKRVLTEQEKMVQAERFKRLREKV